MYSTRVYKLLSSFEIGCLLCICAVCGIKVAPYLLDKDAFHAAAGIFALCVPVFGATLTAVAAFLISQRLDWTKKRAACAASIIAASVTIFSFLLGPVFILLGATWQFLPYSIACGLGFGLFSIATVRSSIYESSSPLLDENASLGITVRSLLGINSKNVEGTLGEADDVFESSRDCGEDHSAKASDESLVEPLPQRGSPRLREYALFGRDHGGEPLKWTIEEIDEGKTLLLSDNILDVCECTIDDLEEYTYEDSDIAEHIRNELVYEIFDGSERALLEGEPRIPSAREMELLYPRDADCIAYPTAYAHTKLNPEAWGAGSYWLSTPGEYSFAYVRPDGDINDKGYSKDAGVHGIRLLITLGFDARKYSHPSNWEEEAAWLIEETNVF